VGARVVFRSAYRIQPPGSQLFQPIARDGPDLAALDSSDPAYIQGRYHHWRLQPRRWMLALSRRLKRR